MNQTPVTVPPAVGDPSDSQERPAVLFVGNSFSKGVPERFVRIAAEHGKRVAADASIFEGEHLSYHVAQRRTFKMISQGGWDVVVLQEQSRMPSRSALVRRFLMTPALRKLVDAVREVGATPVLVQTWGYENGDPRARGDDFHGMTDRLRQGTKAEATRFGIRVVPVGDAWERAVKEGRMDDLFTEDGCHPTGFGNETSARACYEMLESAGLLE